MTLLWMLKAGFGDFNDFALKNIMSFLSSRNTSVVTFDIGEIVICNSSDNCLVST